MQQHNNFTYRRSGSSGCEIVDPDGVVIAWTVDEVWAAMIVAELNRSPTANNINMK